MWSSGFNLSLKLDKSLLYQKSLCLLLGLSIWTVVQSALSVWCQALLVIYLLIHGLRLIRSAIPTSKSVYLFYQGQIWWCEQENQDIQAFDQAVILLHAGLFFLLKLVGENIKPRLLVVFIDQLTEEEMRKLRWIQIIQKGDRKPI